MFIYLNIIWNLAHSGQFTQHKLNTYSNHVSLDNTSAPLNTLPFHTSLYNTRGRVLLCVCCICISCTWSMYTVFFCPSWVHTLRSASFCCCWPQPRIMKRSGILLTPLSLARHECQTLQQHHTLTSGSADGGSLGRVDGAPTFSSWILLMMAAEAGVLGACCLLWIWGLTSAFPSSSRKRLFHSGFRRCTLRCPTC